MKDKPKKPQDRYSYTEADSSCSKSNKCCLDCPFVKCRYDEEVPDIHNLLLDKEWGVVDTLKGVALDGIGWQIS